MSDCRAWSSSMASRWWWSRHSRGQHHLRRRVLPRLPPHTRARCAHHHQWQRERGWLHPHAQACAHSMRCQSSRRVQQGTRKQARRVTRTLALTRTLAMAMAVHGRSGCARQMAIRALLCARAHGHTAAAWVWRTRLHLQPPRARQAARARWLRHMRTLPSCMWIR